MNGKNWATTPLLMLCVLALAAPAHGQFYKQVNLVSDQSGMAAITDPLLVNPWGVSFGPTTPFWVSDAGKNVATLYSVMGATTVSNPGLVVTIPGPPSGQVFNGSSNFVVSSGGSSGPSLFIFAGLNGTISGWSPGVPPPAPSTQAILATGTSAAVYTGIAMGTRGSDLFLFAANNIGGSIEVFDKNFAKVGVPGTFTDPNLPAGNLPFNVVNIGGKLYVTYSGPTGVVNIFDTDGNFLQRFATGGTLLNPWGVALAPADFGKFSNALLIGNFNRGDAGVGPGLINAFDAGTGAFLGTLKDINGADLLIDGLWTLTFGNGNSAGVPDVLYFSAGIQNQLHGLFGSISTCQGPGIANVSADPNMLWPPNHKMVPVTINYTVTNDCEPVPVCSLSVSSNEDAGDGWQVLGPHDVELRAERAGNGDGRVYTITINCEDQAGLSSSAKTAVTVPHDQGH